MTMPNTRRVVAYMSGLRTAVRHFRAFSSCGERPVDFTTDKLIMRNKEWIDESLGPFGPKSKSFPMPGMIGPNFTMKSDIQEIDNVSRVNSDADIQGERHVAALTETVSLSKQVAEKELGAEAQTYIPINSPLDILECAATDCPDLLKKDFRELFPQRDLYADKITVITLSQRTQNDMSMWSAEVDEERETLLENFIKGAAEICESLHEAGYWADFIDPSSGKPGLTQMMRCSKPMNVTDTSALKLMTSDAVKLFGITCGEHDHT